jgi:hypothetical protein
MLGRIFKALKEFQNHWSRLGTAKLSRNEELQVGLPACTALELVYCPIEHLRFLSCSNVQILRWSQSSASPTFDSTALKSFHNFVIPLSSLQNLNILVPQTLGIDPWIHLVVCGAWGQRVWRDIRSVKVQIQFNSSSEASHFFDQTVGYQQLYEKWWKTFAVTKEVGGWFHVNVNASM